MGDPRKLRKKYQTPVHMWQKERIDEERELIKEFGLKNKKEIWKMGAILRNFKDQVKKSIVATGGQSEKEKKQLLIKVRKLGLIGKTAQLDEVLGLGLRDIMERRLQTVVFKKGLASSANQARQFITHEHIVINEKKITSPSYIVSVDEESSISFVQKSKLSAEDHPERTKIKEAKKKKPKEETKEKETRGREQRRK